MGIAKLFSNFSGKFTGWKIAAKVNCVALTIASVTLVSCSIAAWSKNSKILILSSGNCDGTYISRTNLCLHLLINGFSTLVILNAPSREEVDDAHSKGSYLGIGVHSVRNSFMVSKFKTLHWIALLLSSLPIHFLFNSTVFETNHSDSNFHLTIATEKFTHGGTYFPPGASLLVSEEGVFWYLDKYDFNATSILKTATSAGTWARLEPRDCWDYYVHGEGLTKYRDVVIVVSQVDGWTRNDMWHLSTKQSCAWDQYVPADKLNHLFFDTQCFMRHMNTTHRVNSCGVAFGAEYSTMYSQARTFPTDGVFSFMGAAFAKNLSGAASLVPGLWDTTPLSMKKVRRQEETEDNSQEWLGLRPGAFNLTIEYCLVEPTDNICYVMLLPTLLVAVTAAVVAKTLLALRVTVILCRYNRPSLVTLGDAIASFVANPDPVTAGFCTADQGNCQIFSMVNRGFLPEPQCWKALNFQRLSFIPPSVWIISYALFWSSIAMAVFFSALGGNTISHNIFLPSGTNPGIGGWYSLTQAVILANSPQVLLSFCYLAYNNLLTRLQIAKEWVMLSVVYRPLRVTDPEGEQVSTYRLQLPYKYSLPLLGISTGLHWLLSNALYVFVSTGSYYEDLNFSDSILPPGTGVQVKFSEFFILILIVMFTVLTPVPLLLGSKRVPSGIMNLGCNSLALSAACHASRLTYDSEDRLGAPADTQLPTSHTSSLSQEPYVQGQTECELESGRHSIGRLLKKVAQSKIRWGAIKMPPDWYSQYPGDIPVGHLGFGVEEDKVSPPIPGNYYA